MIKVLIFEDEERFRKSLKTYWLLPKTDDEDSISVIADFPNAQNAVNEIQKYQPDVVLMDIQMPGISGIAALEQIKAILPTTKVLMLTNFDDDDNIYKAVCFGAKGYVLKSNVENIEMAVREVHRGGGHMSPSIALRVFNMLQSTVVQSQETYEELSPREGDVLKCMVDGCSYKMIANELKIKYHTVNDHVKRIYKKLHVNSAPQAVRIAIERRLI